MIKSMFTVDSMLVYDERSLAHLQFFAARCNDFLNRIPRFTAASDGTWASLFLRNLQL